MRRKTGDSKMATLHRMLRYIGKHRWELALSLALTVVTVYLTLLLPRITGQAVDLMLGSGLVDIPALGRLLAQILLCAAATGVCQWVTQLCNNRMTYEVVRDIRNDAFAKIQSIPLAYIDTHPHGETESRVIADADQLADGLLMGFSQLFSGVITILGTFFFLAQADVRIALSVVVITPLSLFVAAFISKRTFSLFRQQSELRGEQTGYIHEMIEGHKVVKAFGRQDSVVKAFDDINDRMSACSLRAIFVSSITNPATRFVNSMVYACVGLVGAMLAVRGSLTVGQLSACLRYANQYTKPFNEISGVVAELQNAVACAKRVFDLIDGPSETPDTPDALSPEHFSGEVSLDKVCFSYDAERKLIEDLDLRALPGQRIAIVGPTGCGKTTLINLLMRFYDVQKGVISVDGVDIRDMTRGSLRRGYGMVLQETWLRSGTIRENITMGNPEISEEEMLEVAKRCHIDGFVQRLPNGYETPVLQNGEGFSQGQRQLLCIARVMMSKPSMLILDEATSSIDTRTELHIQEAFNSMMEGRTSFIVAHRLSTIRQADCILVMQKGRIIERGTHASLMKAKGLYYELYQSQFLGKAI